MTQENIFHGIFKDKIVLITGHTGFQGSWLSLWLKMLGANVVGFSLEPPSNPYLFKILDMENEVTSITADLCDKKKLSEFINKHQPEFVFHLAAQPIVLTSYERPLETIETNVIGTANVLESIRNVTSVRSCVIMTSDKCYDNEIKSRPHTEIDPMGGFDPYSASKGAAELIVSSYRNAFFENNPANKTEIATARVGNVIGGGDWGKDRLVPDIIKSIQENKVLNIRNPDSVRPWQYVLEPISGILWLATKMLEEPKKNSSAWNFGPSLSEKSFTVKELVNSILEKWGSDLSFETEKNSNNMHESESLIIDSSKSKKELGWKTCLSFDETVSETVSWHKKYENDKNDIKNFTKRQIENYIIKAKRNSLAWAE